MSLQRAHRLNLTVNILFIAAGCAAEAFSTIVYRIAVIVIVLMLRALWARAVVRRAGKNLSTHAKFDEAQLQGRNWAKSYLREK